MGNDKPLLTANGVGGQIELYEDKVIIRRKGLLALAAQGLKGDKSIYINQISAVQFKGAGMMNGYMQFSFLGGQETKGGMFDAAKDEDSVVFNTWQQKSFLAIKQAIERKLAERGTPQSSSGLGDLEKLAELRDKGIISATEFDAKKKQILGL